MGDNALEWYITRVAELEREVEFMTADRNNERNTRINAQAVRSRAMKDLADAESKLSSCEKELDAAAERRETERRQYASDYETRIAAHVETNNRLRSRLEEVSKAAELISSKDSELRRQNIELRDANRDLRAQFQDIANQTGPRLTKMREERDAALLRLDAIREVLNGDWGINVSSALERVQDILEPGVRRCHEHYKPAGKAIVLTCKLERNHAGDHSDIVVERQENIVVGPAYNDVGVRNGLLGEIAGILTDDSAGTPKERAARAVSLLRSLSE